VGRLLSDKQKAADEMASLYRRIVAMHDEQRRWEEEEEQGGDQGRQTAFEDDRKTSTTSRASSSSSVKSGRSGGSSHSRSGGSGGGSRRGSSGSSRSSTNTFVANTLRSGDGAAIVDLVDGVIALCRTCPEAAPVECHSRYSTSCLGYDPQASRSKRTQTIANANRSSSRSSSRSSNRSGGGGSASQVGGGRRVGWGADEGVGRIDGGLQEVEESDAACDVGDPDAAVRAAQQMRWQHEADAASSGFCHEGGAGAGGGRSGGGSMGACVGGKGPRSRANRKGWMGYGGEREERLRRVEGNGASFPSGGCAHSGSQEEGYGFGYGERGAAAAKAVENFDGGLQANWANMACAATIARKAADDADAEAAAAVAKAPTMDPEEDGYDEDLAEAARVALEFAKQKRIEAVEATEGAAAAAVRAEEGLLTFAEFERAARSYLGCAAHRRHLPEHSARLDRFSDAQIRRLWRQIDWHNDGALDAGTISTRLAVLQERGSGEASVGRGPRTGWGEKQRQEQRLSRHAHKVAGAGAVGAPGRHGGERTGCGGSGDGDAAMRHRSKHAHNPSHARGQRGYAANYASEEVSIANGMLPKGQAHRTTTKHHAQTHIGGGGAQRPRRKGERGSGPVAARGSGSGWR
jgi:hypothetical protein